MRKKRLRERPVAAVTGFTLTFSLITPRAVGGAVGVWANPTVATPIDSTRHSARHRRRLGIRLEGPFIMLTTLRKRVSSPAASPPHSAERLRLSGQSGTKF